MVVGCRKYTLMSVTGGARSFHAKYWDGDPSHDPLLKAIWREQRAEMEGFYTGRDLALGGH